MDIETLKRLIAEAEQGKPELPDDILNFEGGLSAPRVRRLLNALCAQPEARYLEIGVHTGSTFIAAVYGNTAAATCIDRWQMFDNAREQFERNVKRLIPARTFTQIDGDCFNVELNGLRGVNVFFYDGALTLKAIQGDIEKAISIQSEIPICRNGLKQFEKLLIDPFGPESKTLVVNIQHVSVTVRVDRKTIDAFNVNSIWRDDMRGFDVKQIAIDRAKHKGNFGVVFWRSGQEQINARHLRSPLIDS